jgi:HEAT repeat protein
MAHAFISYSRNNHAFIKQFEDEHLRRQTLGLVNFDLWIDEHKIGPGREWTEAIDDNIRGAFALVLVMSQESLASGYVQYEWAFARGARVEVIPVMIDSTAPDKLLMMIRKSQWLSFTNGRYPWEQLYARLNELAPKTSDVSRIVASARQYITSAIVSQRMDAIRTLKELGNEPEALKLLGETVNNSIKTVKSASVRVLLENGSPEAMVHLHTPVAIEPIGAVLEESTQEKLHERGAKALLRIGTEDALIMALRCRLKQIRTVVVERLAAIGKPVIPRLKTALETHETAAVRLAITETLGEIGDEETITILKAVLHDEDPSIRTAAGKALLRFDNPRAEIAALECDDETISREFANVRLEKREGLR